MTDIDTYKEKFPDVFSYASISSNISLLFTVYCIITAILILHFRHWEPEILQQCLGIIAYPIFLFGAVAIASRHDYTNKYVIPICLLAFMLLPLIVSLIGAWILIPLGLLGIFFTAWSCWLSRNAFSSRDLIKLLLASIFLPVFYFLIVNGCNYADIYSDLKGLQGDLHRDTLFHSAIINMLARFGVASTGLDGLTPVAYHIGVHRWVAANLLVLGGETPILLSITQQVALIPAFFFTVIHVVTKLSDRSSSFITTLGFTFAILWLADSRLWYSYLLSESYVFSLSIFVAMLPVGKTWIAQSLKNKLLNAVPLWEIAIALIAIIACFAAKISTGIILGVYLAACVLSPKFLANPKSFVLAIFPLISLSILGLWTVLQYYFNFPFPFSPFYFARSFTYVGDQKLHNSIALTLLITFLAGQIPGILFHGGSASYYFSDPALVVALIYGITVLANSQSFQSHQKHNFCIVSWLHRVFLNFNSGKQPQFYFCYILLAFSLVVVLTSSADFKSYSNNIRKFIVLVQKSSSFSPSTDQFKRIRASIRFQEKFHDLISPPKINKDILLSQTPIGRIKRSITDLDLRKTDKSLAIYIPPFYQEFWSSRRKCWESPFTVPALIGLPLLNGVRSGLGDCEQIKGWGMRDYGKFSLNYELTPTDICTKAKKFGFKKVYEITETKNQMHSCITN
jgi:hypothetical protein